MIARFVDLAWVDYPQIDAVVVAVQQENRASWRALHEAGFRRTWAGTLDSDTPAIRDRASSTSSAARLRHEPPG